VFLYDVEEYVDTNITAFLVFDGDVGSNFSFTYSAGRNGVLKFSGDSSHLEATSSSSVVRRELKSQVKGKVPTGIFVLLY
jgi:hypothetical protein